MLKISLRIAIEPERVHLVAQHLTHYYIYVHLDKAKIATLAKLKASSDVIKR